MIQFCDVCKKFGDQTVLDHVSLTVYDGQVLFIVGKSGAGKSVLVKHLIGLLRPDAGEIFFDEREITHWKEKDFYPLRLKCAMVFQHSTLFDSMSLIENVALPLRKHRHLSHQESLKQALEKLALLGMESYADQLPAMIGDGMRKRVAIARALTLEPEYVIFDEPTTGLDPLSAEQVDQLIRRLSDELKVTSLVVSHDLRSIFTVSDRIVMLYEGKVHFDGTPEQFAACEDPVIYQFVRALPDGPMV